MCVWQSIECRRCEGKVERVIGVSRETGSDVCLGRVGDRPHNLVVKVRQVHSLTHNKSKTVDIPSGILYKQDRLQVMTTDTTFARIYARIFHGHQSVQSRQGRGESLRIRRLQKEGAQGTAGSKAVQGYGHTVRTSSDCNPPSGLDVIGHAALLSNANESKSPTGNHEPKNEFTRECPLGTTTYVHPVASERVFTDE